MTTDEIMRQALRLANLKPDVHSKFAVRQDANGRHDVSVCNKTGVLFAVDGEDVTCKRCLDGIRTLLRTGGN